MDSSRRLMQELSDAYEIRRSHAWFLDADKETEGTLKKQEEQQALLPELTKEEQEASRALTSAEAKAAENRDICTRVSQKCEKALEVFDRIQALEEKKASD